MLIELFAAIAVPRATIVSPVIAGIAAGIALGALLVTRGFQRQTQIAGLLARFDAKEFHVRMWRMEQMTRQGRSAAHVEPMRLKEVEASVAGNAAAVTIFHDALATDWSSSRVDMQAIYFFALEMRNTLSRFRWLGQVGARRLNRAFGYQLLSSYLDQQIVAWRLLPNDNHPRMDDSQRLTYYADNYGLTDPRYVELVNWLADDLLEKRGGDLPPEARKRMRDKRESIDKASRSRRVSADSSYVTAEADNES
jgi:hypothetical protein